MSILKRLQKRWDDWCGDREMEQMIRCHLSENGFFGNTAKLSRIRLAAVARPGWVQVYQFNVRARVRIDSDDDSFEDESDRGPEPDPVYQELFGVLKDDARGKDTKIRVLPTTDDRDELFDRWSEGLIKTRGARSSS